MTEIIKELSSPQQFLVTLVAVITVIIAIAKACPTIWKWFTTASRGINSYEDLNNTVQRHSEEISDLQQKVARNSEENSEYHRRIQEMTDRQQRLIEESLVERELLLRSMLTVIHTLNELGGTTKQTSSIEDEIKSYLLNKSHNVNTL